MILVAKRDGAIVEFHLEKISEAIRKAFKATGKFYTEDIVELLSIRVTSDFQGKMKGDQIAVEDIQDSVEKVLEEAGYTDVAKAYILYRKQREKIRNLGKTTLDYKDVVDNYVKVEDWRVKENSTVTYSVGGLILNNSGAVTTNYWLTEIYDKEIAEAYIGGDLHIHDLSMLTGYSCGWSLKRLLMDGLGGITGKITASPAKHLATLCNQMVNFLGIMQNEWAASQSFSSFDTYLAPFVKADNLSYDRVKKCMEAFVFGVNTPSRWGTQAPFSHISLDLMVPEDMASQKAIVGGQEMDFTYGECQAELDMVDRAFLETMLEGDASGLGFQYPIPSYGLTPDFDWSDNERNRLLFSLASHYGTPYFTNYVRSGLTPGDVRISYDGVTPDLHELRSKAGGFFGYGEHTGSIGVVTINLPRIAYQSKNEAEFYEKLDDLIPWIPSSKTRRSARQSASYLLFESQPPSLRFILSCVLFHFVLRCHFKTNHFLCQFAGAFFMHLFEFSFGDCADAQRGRRPLKKRAGPRRFSSSAPSSGSLSFSYEIIRPAPGPRGSPAPIHRMSSSDQPIRKQMQYGSMVDTSVPIPELSSYFLANTTTMAK